MMKKVSEGHNPHVVAMLGCVTVRNVPIQRKASC